MEARMKSNYRWFVVFVFFVFMLLHQADKLLIGPLTTPIMETFNIDEAAMGAVFSGAIIVAVILYPLWGYLYDRYARSKLLALAAAIWGCTTWLSALVPGNMFPLFVATRASTGIDDSSYPGLYSLISDYFGPHIRGKVYGLLQLTAPIGYILGMVLAMVLVDSLGLDWRIVFYITGGIGILVAVLIFFGVREVPRGQAEPEMAGLEEVGVYKFNLKVALGLFRKRSMLLLFTQGFFGVFPWNVITYWYFRYLETERGFDPGQVLMTMVIAVLVLAAGYPIGGALGDWAFKRTPRGRAIVAAFGVLMGAVLLLITMYIPVENVPLFIISLAATALFMPFAAPNVISTVYDVTEPEVRSTALAIEYFIENFGAATAPFLAGLIAVAASLHTAILVICVSTWLICAVLLVVTAYLLPTDVANLRRVMRERADTERARQVAKA
ncbi:MAG: MFS transporter [Chloroflexi bacterium]|nr:MFS transporter [Chloroflexota bacterium]